MKINNLNWKVKYTDNFEENLFGRTDYDQLTIYISKKVCNQTKNITLKHELVHAYLHSFGFMFKDNFTREDICEFVSHNLETLQELYKEARKELNDEKVI